MIMHTKKQNGINIVMGSNKILFRRFIIILFALLFLGSVFIVSEREYDLFETYRKYWTFVGGLLLLLSILVCCIINKGKIEIPIDAFFKIIFTAGVFESFYAFAQFVNVIPTYNRYFAYTGSFDNPAVFAMMLSVCIPIAVYYANKETINNKKRKIWWLGAIAMLIFVGFSESRTGLLASLLSSIIVIFLMSNSVNKRLFCKRTIFVLIPLFLLFFLLLYLYKADSANGRLLMWRVSMDMIKDHPLFGFGTNGFTTHYMVYQANYLTKNPNSSFLLLADNVNNPFNEYMLVLVNYGLVVFFILLYVIVIIYKQLKTQQETYIILTIGLMVVLLVWSFFSYPFSIPFIWIVTMLIIIIAFLPVACKHYLPICITLIIICITGLCFSFYFYVPEREWQMISKYSKTESKDTFFSKYERLRERLAYNGNFLYNYGAELHYSGNYSKSIIILEECSKKINDYDVQMLIGDCFQKTGDTAKALECYYTASRMVPNRFLPLYYIMNLYLDMNDIRSAEEIANLILEKDVKIARSRTVKRIIREAHEVMDSIKSFEK